MNTREQEGLPVFTSVWGGRIVMNGASFSNSGSFPYDVGRLLAIPNYEGDNSHGFSNNLGCTENFQISVRPVHKRLLGFSENFDERAALLPAGF